MEPVSGKNENGVCEKQVEKPGNTVDKQGLSELMKAHLEEIAGGISSHGSWRSFD